MLNDHPINPFPIGATIANDLAILFHRDWQRDTLARTCNIGLCFGTLSLRHIG